MHIIAFLILAVYAAMVILAFKVTHKAPAQKPVTVALQVVPQPPYAETVLLDLATRQLLVDVVAAIPWTTITAEIRVHRALGNGPNECADDLVYMAGIHHRSTT